MLLDIQTIFIETKVLHALIEYKAKDELFVVSYSILNESSGVTPIHKLINCDKPYFCCRHRFKES